MIDPTARPWRVEERAESFVILSATGFVLGYVYFQTTRNDFSLSPRLGKEEARRVAGEMAGV